MKRNNLFLKRYSNDRNWALISNRLKNKDLNKTPYSLAIEYIKKNNIITAKEVNSVLALADITISQSTLDQILNKPRLSFNNLNQDTILSDIFLDKIGTVRNEKSLAGVYIWTHKPTGAMYVGSSRTLARRLIGYFKGTHESIGKFIPLLNKEGINTFTLEVIIFTDNYYEKQELCLEQYFLLHPKFNLNTLKVVNNISGSRSKPLFLYTKDFSELIYYSEKQEDFIFKLGIHHSIFSRSITKGDIYLNKYIFTNELIEGTKISNTTESDVLLMLEKDRLDERETFKKGRQINLIAENDNNDIKTFNSINDCVTFLKTINFSANKTTLYRYIKTGKPYNGFIVKWANEETFHLKDKSISILVTNIETGKIEQYSSLRKAALALNTTGQTIKVYVDNNRLLEGKYRIIYSNS